MRRIALGRGAGGVAPEVHGTADPRFRAAVNGFRRLFARGRGGGALAVYENGKPVVDVWIGTSDRHHRVPWQHNTATIPYSTSKGIATTVVHRLADRGLLDYDAPVAEYWPEFVANGKSRITIRDVLTHRAGLSRLHGIASDVDELLDHRLMEQRLAAAPPDRLRGVPAYHALTYGWLVAGIARSITGSGMAELFRSEIAEPLGIDDFYLGAPPADASIAVSGFSGSPAVLGSGIAQRMIPTARRVPGPTRALVRTIIVPGIETIFTGDEPPILHTQMPSANAVVTARGLAALYGTIANGGTTEHGTFLSRERIREMSRVQTRRIDRTLYMPMGWRLGYHSFPVPTASSLYGHLGLVGSGALADPRSGIGIALVHNRLPEPRSMLIDQTILAWLAPLVVRAARGEAPTAGLDIGDIPRAG